MTDDSIFSIISLLISIVAVYFASKKQSSEVDNIDADTISTLYDTITKQEKFYKESQKEQEEQYKKLKKEFEDYKQIMNGQIEYLQKESTRWRKWAEHLDRQLKDNGIQPENFISIL
jgi:flagellar motility protein MotE (MotC chaperone)